VPLPDASVDVIISNCAIDLSGDKSSMLDLEAAGLLDIEIVGAHRVHEHAASAISRRVAERPRPHGAGGQAFTFSSHGRRQAQVSEGVTRSRVEETRRW